MESQILKISPAGDILWQTDVGCSTELFETSSGDIIVCGNDGALEEALILTKINPNGEILWIKNYRNYLGESRGESIIETLDGGYAVLGRSRTDSAILVMALLKVSCEGEVQSFHCLPGPLPDPIEIFPNPFSEEITVQLNGNETWEQGAELRIWDVTDRLLRTEIALKSGTNGINLQYLLPGMYFFEIRQGDQRSVQRVVKP